MLTGSREQELSFIAGWNAKMVCYFGRQFGSLAVSYKTKHIFAIPYSNPTPWTYLRELKIHENLTNVL